MDWTEHGFLLLNILLLIPLMVWACALMILYLRARSGRIEVTTNLLALSGAIVGLCSVIIGWSVVERGEDWEISTAVYVWLFFTYPLTFLTPVAGIGNAAVLTWASGLAHQEGGAIEPMLGFILGWVSVVILVAGIVVPAGLMYDGRWTPSLGCRFLTLTYRARVESVSEKMRETPVSAP